VHNVTKYRPLSTRKRPKNEPDKSCEACGLSESSEPDRRKSRARTLYDFEVERREQGWGDPAFVYDKERDLFRWTDGRFAFSRERAEMALQRGGARPTSVAKPQGRGILRGVPAEVFLMES